MQQIMEKKEINKGLDDIIVNIRFIHKEMTL
jgi:hypothetical protein